MTEHIIYDTLLGYHAQNTDNIAYSSMAHLIVVLEEYDGTNLNLVGRNVSNLLGEVEAMHIMHLICQRSHIDYLELMQDCQKITLRHITPRLLLQIACLPISYVEDKLEIDQFWASQLLDKLRHNFTIDDPILWLKRLLNQTEKERLHYAHAKEDLLHGLAVTNQPVDTAEERKLKDRRQYLNFKPPFET
jgi:hypothetical protein